MNWVKELLFVLGCVFVVTAWNWVYVSWMSIMLVVGITCMVYGIVWDSL